MSLRYRKELTRVELAVEKLKTKLEQLEGNLKTTLDEKEELRSENWTLKRDQATHEHSEQEFQQLENVIHQLQIRKTQSESQMKDIRRQLNALRQAIKQ